MFYAVYSFPNIFFPLLGGLLMDKFGARTLIFLSAGLVTIGQAVFAFGVSIGSFPVALLGRGIFGCGGENLDIGQSVIVIRWFAGNELSMAFGINSTLSLLGSVLNDNIEPLIDKEMNLNAALWFGFIVCLGSFGACIIVNVMDKKRDRIIGIKAKSDLPDNERFRLRDIKEFDLMF